MKKNYVTNGQIYKVYIENIKLKCSDFKKEVDKYYEDNKQFIDIGDRLLTTFLERLKELVLKYGFSIPRCFLVKNQDIENYYFIRISACDSLDEVTVLSDYFWSLVYEPPLVKYS